MISFTVEGQPAPKGSFRVSAGRGRTRRGRQRMVVRSDSPRTDAWEQAVSWASRAAMGPRRPLTGAVRVSLCFFLRRPKSVKRGRPAVKPDLDKLVRSTLDAMASLVYRDDALVVSLTATKDYADDEAPGVHVHVEEVETP